MKFEGTQVNIPIKGIMRAGTDNLCADGAMNEVVGMEYKDGSWLPYKEGERLWTVLVEDGVVNEEVNWSEVFNIVDVYTHKTSDSEERLLFLLSDGRLLYEDHRNLGNPIEVFTKVLVESGVKSVSFVGNMICVATESVVKHYLWNAQKNNYSIKSTKYTPLVELRTSLGFTNDFEEDDKIVGLRKTLRLVNQSDPISRNRNGELIKSAAVSALGELRDRGGLVGYVLACTAYRLENGELVFASAPVLLGPPQDALERPYNISMNPDTGVYDGTFKEYNSSDENKNLIFQDFLTTELISDPPVPDGGMTPEDFEFIYKRDHYDTPSPDSAGMCYTKGGGYISDSDSSPRKLYLIYKGKGDFPYSSDDYWWPTVRDYEQFQSPLVPPLVCTRNTVIHDEGGSNEKRDYYYFAFAASNKLQYKIPVFSKEEAENANVQSVCLFISQEITPFVLEKESDFDNLFNSSPDSLMYERVSHAYTQTYHPIRKQKEKLIEEIKGIKSLYLIKEIPISEIEESDEWIDINLDGQLRDVLLTHEQLPLTAFDYTTSIPQNTSAYNYRLHVYNYIQRLFEGYTIGEFAHHGGLFQEPENSFSSQLYKWEIKVELNDEHGNSKVVSYSKESVNEIIVSLSPILSYPSINAKSMTIRVYDITNHLMYAKSFPLTANENTGLSYYIDPSLKPISMFVRPSGLFHTSIPYFHPENYTFPYHNGLKVSDVAYPSYFPAEYTYRLGNEKIIGLARLTMPMSQDNFGNYSLIAFCTDGIYSLRVDASGNGAYTSQAFVSPEVCLNPNSICEIGGAVFFAGDKGLMVLTGENNVELYAPQLNGVPRFLPASVQSKEARGIYRKMIDSEQILSKENDNFYDSISQEDFKDFIVHSDTHLIYISNKNKLLAYNKSYDFSYFIDIPTHNTTKLSMSAKCDDGDIIGRTIWEEGDEYYTVHTFGYLSETDNSIPCLVQSRPIKVQQDDKCSYRVVLTGYFEGTEDHWADLVVLGSLDADHWRVIGVKEKKLVGGFHNLGCLTERGSWKYLMFIFAGQLSNNSHIDSVDITIDGRYNNKKR